MAGMSGNAPVPQPEAPGCAEQEPYALRVLGDSMEPEFADGCIVIVDPGGRAEDGAYVVARVDGGPLFRQYRVEDGRHWLCPVNPGYPRRELSGRPEIVGVVTQRAGTRRAYRRHYV